MIQKLKDAPWSKPAALTLAALLVMVAWLWLAGGIFLKRYGQDYTAASPLTLYRYWYYYGHEKQAILWMELSMLAAGVLVALLGFVLYKPKKKPSLYGDAKLATRRDLVKAGLLGSKGLLVGKDGRDYLKFDSEEHVLLVAPTREKKGVAIVIPNALSWQQSMVALDTKEEIFDLTSGYRTGYQPVFVFNPVSDTYQTHRYNTLAYVSTDPNLRINDLDKIGNMLIPEVLGKDPIWTATPRALFLGISLMLFETPGKPVTLGQVLRESVYEGDGSAYFTRLIKERAEAGNPFSGACVRAMTTYTSIDADVTRAGIIAGFRSRLELWANPLVDAATSANDFDLREVRKTPMTIYVCVTQDNLERMAPLLNLFFQQLIGLNTRVLPRKDKALKYKCLLLMDEMATIGKIPALAKGIAYLAGYGLRIMSVFQSTAQVAEINGRESAKNYTANHGLQIAYAPKATETESAREISEWLGYTTVKGKPKSKDGPAQPDQRRALMLPQEVIGMGSEWSLIVKRGMPPAKVRKIEYYSDPEFTSRLLPPVMLPALDMEAHNRVVDAATPASRGALVFAPGEEVTRDLTAADVPNFGKLAIGQFVLDFSTVTAPVTDTLDIAALHAYADMRCREAGITVEVANG
jgi:type IV secretion system protein VirD4